MSWVGRVQWRTVTDMGIVRLTTLPLRVMSRSARLLRSVLMADFLSAYALTQTDKVALVEDRAEDRAEHRADGTVRQFTFGQLDAASNRLANVLLDLGVRPGESKGGSEGGSKVVWCGQNSIGLVLMINAARKLGVTAVPLNYRLSDEEAAYVTDHSDATVVYVDAEFAPMF